MKVFVCIFTIYIFIYSISYSIYEFKNNKNKQGGITSCLLGTFQLLFTNYTLFFLK